MVGAPISLRLTPELKNKVITRGENKTQVIHRDLKRLYTLYARALDSLHLSTGEVLLLSHCLDSLSETLPWRNLADAIRIYRADAFGVDAEALIAKLDNLNDIQAMALIDAGERVKLIRKSHKRFTRRDLDRLIGHCFKADQDQDQE